MKLGERAFGELEPVGQQLGYCECWLSDAAASVNVRLFNHVIQFVGHQARHCTGVDEFPRGTRLFPQRRSEKRVEGGAVDIAKGKNHSVGDGAGGKSKSSLHRVLEIRIHFRRTARSSQANHGGVVVFQAVPVDGRIAPVHMNGRGLHESTHFLLELQECGWGNRRIRTKKDDQPFMWTDRLRTADGGAHAEHASEGEDVCNTGHSTPSVVQKI